MSRAPRQVSVDRRGDAAPQVVWQRYLDPATWPSWAPHIADVVYPHPRLRPGTDGLVKGPVGVRAHFRIDEIDGTDKTRRVWRWAVRCGPVRLRLEHLVEPCAAGTRATIIIQGPPVLTDAYAWACRPALTRLVRP